MELVHRMGPISRAQIARASGLSKPTVSQALAALEAASLVRQAGRATGARGPSAVLYELNPRAGWVVGIDIGRRFVRAAVADLAGDVLARRDERSDARSSRALITQIGRIARATAAEAGTGWEEVTTVAVGSPGVFHPDDDQVVLAHNLPGWGRPGLLQAIRDELGVDVAFENDVNLATVGEGWRGLGKGVANFVYLHVGTGVGLGLVLNGELYKGATGAAGEIGYLPFGGDPRASSARRRGPLESVLGARGIMTVAKALGMRAPASPRRIFAAARAGDPVAQEVVGKVAEGIALAVAAVASIVDPELVILGGGIGRNGDLLLDRVERELRTLSPFSPRLEVSVLGPEAELTGAVALALEAAQERLFARDPGASR